MGNREALLAGAKRCLYEKGYARTTARDIAAASGVSLAAIGYHFGSVEALLNAAMIQAIDDWGQQLGRDLAADAEQFAALEPLERFAAIWTRVIESLDTGRPLWVATLEVAAQIERAPEVRAFLADALQEGRLGLAQLFQGIDPIADKHTAWMVGSLYQALMSGVVVQWLADPERAPSGVDLANALRIITEAVEGKPADR
jgi:AcrR family transcriptional regulator